MSIICLNGLVGLVDSGNLNCACFDASKPTDFLTQNASESGRFIVSKDFGSPLLESILKSNDCEDGSNLWTTLINVRETAQKELLSAILAEMRAAYSSRITGLLNEDVGERKTTGVRSVNTSRAGVQLRPHRLKDFKYHVQKIWTGFNQTHTFDLKVNSDNPDFAETTVPLTATANTWTENTLESEIMLPFWGTSFLEDSVKGPRYSYNLTYPKTSPNPLQNRFHCGCPSGRPGWTKFLEAGGYEANTDNSFSCFAGSSSNGIVLSGYISCDNLQWLCNLDEAGAGYDLKAVLAEAWKLKGVEILANHVLQSGRIGWSVFNNTDEIYALRARANREFGNRIKWLALNFPKGSTDCYKCKDMQIRLASL